MQSLSRCYTSIPNTIHNNGHSILVWFDQSSHHASMTDKMHSFRDLLKPKTPFYLDHQLQQLFEESKQHILESIQHGITIFDKGRSTCFLTDFSKDGIGFSSCKNIVTVQMMCHFVAMMDGKSRWSAVDSPTLQNPDTRLSRKKL